ncbi:MAG: hypothetical protein R2718_01840 [Solirubrobacterales bacterium]
MTRPEIFPRSPAVPGAPGLRTAALPLLATGIAVSLLSALSGGPLDALAGLPMLLVALALVLGRSAGVEALVALTERLDRSRSFGRAPLRRRFPTPPDHAPALSLLTAGRPLRGPPAIAGA